MPHSIPPLLNQKVHSLLPCDLFVAGERTGETGQATGDNQTTVITTKLGQTVDEIHVQQRISTVGDRQSEDQSPVTGVALFAGVTATGVQYALQTST